MCARMNPNYVTTFKSYSFEYQWKISKVRGRLSNTQPLVCPEDIKSPAGQLPFTKWRLQALGVDGNNYYIVKLNIIEGSAWANVKIGLLKVKDASTQSADIDSPPEYNLYDLPLSPSCFLKPHTIRVNCSHITKNSFVGYISKNELHKYLVDDNLLIHCFFFVNNLDTPVHVKNIPVVEAKSSKFDLSKLLEDARHKDQYTDVTIVANGKEFKAHKLVLVSQSPFFETCLEERWTEHGGNRIEMLDVPANTMDTILTYMYTGKVANIDQAALELLCRADEYQLESLKAMCEESLCKTLTAKTAIDILVMADTHNAQKLKQYCLTFIAKNISDVKRSSAWTEGKLKSEEKKDLWVDVLEHTVKLL